MRRRIVVFGSPSGLDIWGPAVAVIPGVDVSFVPHQASDGPGQTSTLRSFQDVRRAARGADAVIVISTLLGAGVAATERRTPVVAIDIGAARFAETHQRAGRWPVAMVLRMPSLIVGVTSAHVAALATIRGRPARVRLVRQPTRPPACTWQPDQRDPYVVSVGSSGRDLKLLMEAAKRVPFTTKIVAGGRELVPAPGTKLPEDLPSNVEWLGQVTRDAYLGLLAQASAVILPLPYANYPVGVTVMLDAMATGIPIVATAVPSVMEYQGNETSFVVPPGDAPALAEAITVAVKDRAQATRVAAAARLHVERIAGPDVVAARFASVLDDLR